MVDEKPNKTKINSKICIKYFIIKETVISFMLNI